MVQIPTARDVNRVGTQSGRISPNAPSNPIGQALAGFGQDLTRVAYDLNDLRTQEAQDNQNKTGFDLETKIAKFRDQEEQGFLKARDETSESGIGFTRQHIEGYQKRADEFAESNFVGLSEAQKARAKQSILGLGNSLYEKANSYERQAKTAFYDRTTNQGLDSVRTQINNNAAPYEDLKKQGLAAIDAADMPEPWKAERRAIWDADAAESKWQWKFKQDPETAVRQMKGISVDAKSLAGAIQQTSEQLGINPVDLATAMSYETGGTFDPWQKGPTTKWGQHRGLIQWGEPQRQKYGVTEDMPIEQQVAAAGQYLKDAGVKPGMGLLDIYSAINAGAPGLYDRSDYKAGGAPGTVADKVKSQMEGHKAKAAALLGGEYVPTPGDPDMDAIPYDRRQQLASWGETQVGQQRVQQRAAAKDSYSLLIATQPDQVSESVILSDITIDNGDKAQLINSLRAAVKKDSGVNAFISGLGSGSVSVNPFDADQRKIADAAYEKILSASDPEQQNVMAADFVGKTGYIPQKVQAELRRGATSTQPADVAQSLQMADRLQTAAPQSFGAFEGSAAVTKNLDLFRSYTNVMGLSPEEAGRKVVAANDPQQMQVREALLKSDTVKKLLKDTNEDQVAAIFDKGMFSAAPEVGQNPAAKAAMVGDYRTILEESIVDANGDQDIANKMAADRFQRIYGTSDFSTAGAGVVVKYPPEKAYPVGPDGTHAYVKAQAAQALRAEGVQADEIFLQADQTTEKDIKAGKPARYQVFYQQDGKMERYFLPFYADPAAVKAEAQQKRAQEIDTLRNQMIETRDRFAADRASDQQTYDETVGPDWMKAQQMQAGQERRRQDETLKRQGGFNPGPLSSGGGGW